VKAGALFVCALENARRNAYINITAAPMGLRGKFHFEGTP
jgi:hypothetical protein